MSCILSFDVEATYCLIFWPELARLSPSVILERSFGFEVVVEVEVEVVLISGGEVKSFVSFSIAFSFSPSLPVSLNLQLPKQMLSELMINIIKTVITRIVNNSSF